MPTTLELETPASQESGPASPTINVSETGIPAARRKRGKKGRAHKTNQRACEEVQAGAPSRTSPPVGTVKKPGGEGGAALADEGKRNRRKKPVRMGEALRGQGLDEHSVARTLAQVVDTLKGKSEGSDDVDKLLVDVLKECSRHLEEDNKAAESAPVRVKLVHNVARPQRNAPATAQPAGPHD